MANAGHLTLLRQGVEAWNQWRQTNPDVKPDLYNADFRAADLSRANLSDANLREADLAGADLTEAKLSGADLSFTNLSKGSFRAANLRNINLHNADLSGANLSDADLSLGDLNKANFKGTIINDATELDPKWILTVELVNGGGVGRELAGTDLSHACLTGADLQSTDLSGAILSYANLSQANLSGTNLREAKLYLANLSEANLQGAVLNGSELAYANVTDTDLSNAELWLTDLNNANLSGANLRGAILRETNAVETNFTNAVFTATCLQDCNTNSVTNFEGAVCDYIYLKDKQQERRPREGNFNPGEFAALFQQAVDTVDLIFKDGIDWQAFFQCFQDLRSQYADQDLAIQAIERKHGGAFVIRVEATKGADLAAIESSAKELYEIKLVLLEQRYRAELQAKDGKIVAYREQSANLMKIIEMLAARPPMSEGKQIIFNQPQFGGGYVAGDVQGDQVGGTINNAAAETPSLAEAAAEIQNLLKQLEASNPSPTQAQQTAYLDAVIPPTRRERFVGALRAAGGAVIEEVPYGAVLKALVEGWQRPEG